MTDKVADSSKEKLSPEDMKRVESVLYSGYNTTERQPFRFWRLFFILWTIVAIIGIVCWRLGLYISESL